MPRLFYNATKEHRVLRLADLAGCVSSSPDGRRFDDVCYVWVKSNFQVYSLPGSVIGILLTES